MSTTWPALDVVPCSGDVGPVHSFELDRRLDELTTEVRPFVIVDLSEATHVHPAVVSVVIRHRRQARRQGGDHADKQQADGGSPGLVLAAEETA